MNNANPFCGGRVKGVLSTIRLPGYSSEAALVSISGTEASGPTLFHFGLMSRELFPLGSSGPDKQSSDKREKSLSQVYGHTDSAILGILYLLAHFICTAELMDLQRLK